MIKFIIDTHFVNLISQKTGEIMTDTQVKDNLWQQIFYHLNKENMQQVENLLNEVEKLIQNDINNFNLAKMKIHSTKGEYEQSVLYAKQILTMANKDNLLTQALTGLGKGIEKLIPLSNEYASILYAAYQINPNDETTLLALGNYFISSKEYNKAEECYKQLEKVNPQHQFLNKNNALLCECKREYRESLKYLFKYKKQVESQKNTDEIKYTYSKIINCVQRLKKVCLALGYAKRLVKLKNSANNLFMLANCYNRLNQQAKAQEYCEKALEQAKDCNTIETIQFSLNLSKIRQDKLNVAKLDTKLYSYHAATNLWGLYEDRKNQKDDFQRVFNIIIRNAYEHHNANDDSEKPKILYKYVEFNERTKEILKKEYLYLSTPEKFNDPFDPPIKQAEKYNEVKELLGNMRIGCVSEQWNNNLMWSHYANSHKGLCIGYDVSDIFKQDFTKQNTILRKCIYIDDIYLNSLSLEIPIINDRDLEPFKNNMFKQPSLLDMYSIKHKNWEYEQEWRIIVYNNNNNFIKLPIREVYFGLEMRYKKCIAKCIQEINKNIKLYEIKHNDDLYHLDRDEFNDNSPYS